MNKKMMMIVGAVVVVVVLVVVFSGGEDKDDASVSTTGGSSTLTTLLDEYETETDKMIAKYQGGDFSAVTDYGTWAQAWTAKWTAAVKDMDMADYVDANKRMLEIAKKWTKALQ